MTENARHAAFRQCVLAAATAIVAILIVIAVAFATQGHNDRVLMEDLDRTGVELQLLGRQIGDIKDADLVSMNDYISAYAQVEHLQSDYDQKLQKYSELYSLARKRDSDRGIFNVERFQGKHHPETWQNMTEIIDLVRQINELTKRQTAVIHAMASLSEPERVKFWHEQFAPLAAEGARAAREAAGHRTGNAARRKSSIGSQEVPLKSQAAPRRSFFLQTVSLSLR